MISTSVLNDNSSKMVDILLQASAHEYQYESSSQTESKKGYSFLYPSSLSYSDDECRAMAPSFARPFPTFKPFLLA